MGGAGTDPELGDGRELLPDARGWADSASLGLGLAPAQDPVVLSLGSTGSNPGPSAAVNKAINTGGARGGPGWAPGSAAGGLRDTGGG